MERHKPLRVSHVHGLARFEVENHLVLRAVIFEHAADVLHARKGIKEDQEDAHAKNAVRHVDGEATAERGNRFADARGQEQRHELIEEDEEPE